VQDHAVVEDSILFGGVTVSPGARVRRAILDKWTVVPDGVTIGFDPAEDARRFTVTDSGIVVVPPRYSWNGVHKTPLEFNTHFPRPGE
jgi:glucose-1-phosphate adenylyltransferase